MRLLTIAITMMKKQEIIRSLDKDILADVVADILARGNTVEIRKRKDEIVVLEVSAKLKQSIQ